jgi:cohesin loading factor subunit SCC2
VLNAHAERLFDLTQSKDRKIRYASLELIDVLLRQGLVNPNDAVPYLFSLQGDIEQHQNRCVALRLLMTEGEKRPDMIRQRICAGVKKAYEFQRTMYPHKTSVSALVEEKRGRSVVHACIFDCVFKECIRSSRKQRLGLYDNLLSQFEADNSSSRSFGTPKGARKKEIRSLDLDLLGFSAQILAHLPYNSAEEPLYIIYKISSVITLHGGQILDKLASILRPIGLASSDDLDEVNTSEDVLEKIANAKSPSRTQEGKLLNSKVADKEQFADLCRDGFALTILLRLKDFLRGMYNLSETRCLQYDPNAKDRIAEKGISKADARKLFDPNVPPDARKENDKVINDTTIRQYAEFRVLMRKEMAGNLEASMGEDCDEVSVPDIEHESENGSPQKSRAEEIQ